MQFFFGSVYTNWSQLNNTLLIQWIISVLTFKLIARYVFNNLIVPSGLYRSKVKQEFSVYLEEG